MNPVLDRREYDARGAAGLAILEFWACEAEAAGILATKALLERVRTELAGR